MAEQHAAAQDRDRRVGGEEALQRDVQLMLDAGVLDLSGWRTGVDLGDHVGVSGEVITSRRGELSVLVDEWTVTAKCLHPLPDKRKGLTDPENSLADAAVQDLLDYLAAFPGFNGSLVGGQKTWRMTQNMTVTEP